MRLQHQCIAELAKQHMLRQSEDDQASVIWTQPNQAPIKFCQARAYYDTQGMQHMTKQYTNCTVV